MLCPHTSQTNNAHTPPPTLVPNAVTSTVTPLAATTAACIPEVTDSILGPQKGKPEQCFKCTKSRYITVARIKQIVVMTPCSLAGELLTFRYNLLPLPPSLWLPFRDIPVIANHSTRHHKRKIGLYDVALEIPQFLKLNSVPAYLQNNALISKFSQIHTTKSHFLPKAK